VPSFYPSPPPPPIFPFLLLHHSPHCKIVKIHSCSFGSDFSWVYCLLTLIRITYWNNLCATSCICCVKTMTCCLHSPILYAYKRPNSGYEWKWRLRLWVEHRILLTTLHQISETWFLIFFFASLILNLWITNFLHLLAVVTLCHLLWLCSQFNFSRSAMLEFWNQFKTFSANFISFHLLRLSTKIHCTQNKCARYLRVG